MFLMECCDWLKAHGSEIESQLACIREEFDPLCTLHNINRRTYYEAMKEWYDRAFSCYQLYALENPIYYKKPNIREEDNIAIRAHFLAGAIAHAIMAKSIGKKIS